METLETDRLVIRKLVPADFTNVSELLTDNFDYFNGPFLDREDTNARLDWIVSLSNWKTAGGYYGDRGIIIKQHTTLAGLCGIDPWLWKAATKQRVPGLFTDGPHDPDHSTIEFELGYALNTEFRGHGYATEAARKVIDWAFNEGHVYRILARTNRENVPSIQVMERVGMQISTNEEWGGAAGIIRNPTT